MINLEDIINALTQHIDEQVRHLGKSDAAIVYQGVAEHCVDLSNEMNSDD